MHAVMLENLEDYLAGTLEPAQFREVEAHLGACGICREELRGMQELESMFGVLRPEQTETWEFAPSFTAKVMQRVARREPVPASASFFALNLAFGRRLVFASLMAVALLGGYLVTHEVQYPVGPSPEAILAQQNTPAFETGGAENNMLATLTAYEH
jgi:anti-sigma factor RsiW